MTLENDNVDYEPIYLDKVCLFSVLRLRGGYGILFFDFACLCFCRINSAVFVLAFILNYTFTYLYR